MGRKNANTTTCAAPAKHTAVDEVTCRTRAAVTAGNLDTCHQVASQIEDILDYRQDKDESDSKPAEALPPLTAILYDAERFSDRLVERLHRIRDRLG